MREVFDDPAKPAFWVAAARGKPDWPAIFDGYRATLDYPGCSFWQELTAFYPDAKVLLSVRDPDSWFESTRETIFSAEWNEMCMNSPMREFFKLTVYDAFGDRIHDRAFMTEYFLRHSAAVKAAIPNDRLLVYDVRDGWEPLCTFLDVEIPAAPFPHSNTREEMKEHRRSARLGERPAGALAVHDDSARPSD
jgi:hypothetical protein